MGSLKERFGPKNANHPSVGKPCSACRKKFKAGDYTTLVALGPGDSKEQQKKARAGRAFNAVAVEVHWICATGQAGGHGNMDKLDTLN